MVLVIGTVYKYHQCMCHFKQNYTARMEDSDQSGTVVAVCQMNSTNEVERNLEICEDLIRKAKTRGAKVINIFLGNIGCFHLECYSVHPVEPRVWWCSKRYLIL